MKVGLFKPEGKITREEVAKVVSNLISETTKNSVSNTSFIDVSEERWSYGSIQKLVKNGILRGYTDGTYRPQNSITRAEIAIVLMRLCEERKEY